MAILGGVALIERFHIVIYILGVLLLVLAWRILRGVEEGVDPDKNLIVRGVRKVFPVAGDFHGHHWFVRIDGKRHATPIFVAWPRSWRPTSRSRSTRSRSPSRSHATRC